MENGVNDVGRKLLQELCNAVSQYAATRGHPKKLIDENIAQAKVALSKLLLSDAVELDASFEGATIPIQSSEHQEFVEENYPVLKEGDIMEFPKTMVHSTGNIYHAAIVKRVIKRFASGHTHTALFEGLRNLKTDEFFVGEDGGLAEIELHLFGMQNMWGRPD